MNPLDAVQSKINQPNPLDAIGSSTPVASNPLDAALGNSSTNPLDQPVRTEKPGEAQRMGEGEAWYSKPLTTYVGIPEFREGAGPVERSVEKFASGLTSPLSVGLMLVTGGLGGLAEAGAAEAGEGAITSLAGRAGEAVLNTLPRETALKVASASNVVSKLANLGFTGQQIAGVARAVPRIGDAWKAGDWDTVQEMTTDALLSGAMAAASTYHFARSLKGGKATEPTWTGDKDVIAASQQPTRAAGEQANRFERANAALIKNSLMDQAARLYHEAGGDNVTLEKWRQEIEADSDVKPTQKLKYGTLLQKAQNLPADVKVLSAQLKNDYAKDWQELQTIGKVDPTSPGRANYAGQHTYKPQDDSSSLQYVGKLTKSPGFIKARTYDTIVDAVHDGFEPKEVGLTASRAEYIRSLGGMRGAIAAEEELLKQRADDDRPMAIAPASIQNIDGKKVVAAPTPASSTDVITINGKPYYDVSDYREGPDVFSRYRFRTNDEDGKPVFDRVNLLIHPQYLDKINQAFDDHSWFRTNPIMKAALGVSTEAKKSLLSFSPFHWTTEYLRGIQMGLNPIEALNPESLTENSLAVKSKFAPMTTLQNAKGMADYAEGLAEHSTLINRIPVAGKMLSAVENKLFGANGYIDRLKGASFEKVVNQIAKRNPGWSDDQVQFQASKIVDAAFGGLNYKMLGMSMNSRDALRLVMLAPDFTGSQLLFGKYGFDPGGSVVQQSLGRIALYNFAVARVLNLLISQNLHMEHPFSVVSPDEKKLFSIRTMPADLAHALTDFRGFASNRLNPVLGRTGLELLTQRDSQGKVVTTQKEILDLLRNVLPIPIQPFTPVKREETNWEGAARGLGIGVQNNPSTADLLAGKLASNHSESGPVDSDKLAHHQAVLRYEDDLRDGKIQSADLFDAHEAGTLTKKDVVAIRDNVRDTKGMDAATARLYTRSIHLPIKDLLQVWDVATPPEKAGLEKLLMKKRAAYLKTANENETLAERQHDPVYKRLRDLYPNEPPW